MARNDPQFHARSPFFINNSYIWTEVRIIDYDCEKEKYQVQVGLNG